jgi:hypothetical protein
MKKVALIINNQIQAYDVDSVQVVTGNLEGYDIAVLLNTAEEESNVIDPGIKPSSSSFSKESFSKTTPLEDVNEAVSALSAEREKVSSKVIDNINVEVHRRTNKMQQVVITKYRQYNEPQAIENSVKELVANELLLISPDQVLFFDEKPVFMFNDNGEQFRIKEKVSVYEIIMSTLPNTENATVVKETNEETEIKEILEDLFKRNPNHYKVVKNVDSGFDTSYEFFVSQIVLSTGNKVKREVITKILDTLLTN